MSCNQSIVNYWNYYFTVNTEDEPGIWKKLFTSVGEMVKLIKQYMVKIISNHLSRKVAICLIKIN